MICLWFELTVSGVLLLAALLFAGTNAWRGGAYRRLVVRRRVVVNLLDGKAFEGVVTRHEGPLLILRDVTYLEPGSPPASLDGEVLVERSRVDFIQAP
jgi:hypothetical protein